MTFSENNLNFLLNKILYFKKFLFCLQSLKLKLLLKLKRNYDKYNANKLNLYLFI